MTREPTPRELTRAGRVAILGRPNVGKSTLLNAALEHPLAIVSPTPQTTRDAILGIVRHEGAEISLLDTPGLHKPITRLGRAMNRTAREAARGADVIVFVTDVPSDKRNLRVHPGDHTLLADIGAELPTVLVVNKVDLVPNKGALLPLLEALSRERSFAALVPVCARKQSGVTRVLDEVAKLCPERAPQYQADDLTDRPVRFFAAEFVREQILRATKEEVPHAAAVEIERFVEPDGPGAVHIDATIHVEREGQKRILIGAGAEKLKRIGTAARLRIEELVGRKVALKLFVRVTPAWRDSERLLAELGYTSRNGGVGGGAPDHDDAPPPPEEEEEDEPGR